MILTGLLLYSSSIISMLFIGRLDELALAGKSPAIDFANITGYSILLGLAMGMEPICGQAFGAKKHSARPLLAEDGPPPTIYILTNFSSLAEHEENPSHLWPGRSDREAPSVLSLIFSLNLFSTL
ncbi:hypothetical protein ACFX2A_042932 [Malus domestica]